MCVGWQALCNEGTSLWEQLVSGVSERPHLNFVLTSNSGAAFSPNLKVKQTKADRMLKNPSWLCLFLQHVLDE